jgi:tetratricopeptide (TPR) repeat protein
MKRLLLVVSLLVVASSGWAAPADPPGRAADLLNRARALRATSDLSAAPMAEEAAAAARASGNRELEIDALLLAGECYFTVNRLDGAERALGQALELSRKTGTAGRTAEALFRLGRTQVAMNRPALGIENYQEAIRLAEGSGDRELAAVITDVLGIAHYMLRNYERAMTLCRQAEPVLAKATNRALAAENLEHIGIIYTGEDRAADALTYFTRALEIREQVDNRLALAGTLGDVTLALNALKRHQEALVPINRALELTKDAEDRRVASYLRLRRAKVLQALGRPAEAERDFEQALATDRTLGNNRRLASTLIAVAGFYRSVPGHEQRAIAALEEAVALNRSVYDEETTSRVNELQERFEAERRSKRIELLERDKAIAELRARQDRQIRLAIGLVSVLLIAGLIFAIVRYQAEARTTHQLREALASVRTLQGLLPICAHCKKIRNDDGYWQQVESYIGQRSDARFSHGICPDCAREHYPGLLDEERPQPSG